MAQNINSVTIGGNLCADPDLRQTPAGLSVLRFRIASNENRKGADGQWEEYPNYVDCTVFGNRCDWLSQALRKGTKVAILGRLHYSAWTDEQGNKRSKLEVIVSELEILRRDSTQQQPQAQAQQPQPVQAAPQAVQYQAQPQPVQYQAAQPVAVYSDDPIPF